MPEPKNPADQNAIAVLSCRGVQLGYLTAERAPLVRNVIGQGREVACVFQGRARFGAWIRCAFDGEAPALPDQPVVGAVTPAADDTGFWPDDDWLDD